MKMLRALPLLIITLGCSGMSVAEQEWHNERIHQTDYDLIKAEIEKQGYADISITVHYSDYMQQIEKSIAKDDYKRPDKNEKARRQEMFDMMREKIQQRKGKAVEAIRDKLDKEIKNGSRHFELGGDFLNKKLVSFRARIWTQEAFDILVTVEEIADISTDRPGVLDADELTPYDPEPTPPTPTPEVYDTEAVKLLQQPEAALRGYEGEGQLVAVLDNAIHLYDNVVTGGCIATESLDTRRTIHA